MEEEGGGFSERDVLGVSFAELLWLFRLPEAFAGGCFPAAWLFAERAGGWAVVLRERLLALGGVSCGGSFRFAELAGGAFCARRLLASWRRAAFSFRRWSCADT